MDFVLNGQAFGEIAGTSVGQMLMATGFNTNVCRPYNIDGRGTYITVTENGKQVPKLISNAPAVLRKDEWIQLDKVVVAAALPRLRAVAEIRRRGLTYSIPNGMGKTVLQSQTMSDITDAEVSMNGVKESNRDRPVFDIGNLPLPIIHKDFSFYLREIETSRNGGSPIDTTMAEGASRKVAEYAEKLLIGSAGTYKYGGGFIYGLTNYPSRITKVITAPTATGWTPVTLVNEILAMKQLSMDKFHFGPWLLFVGQSWDQYLDRDYVASGGNNPNQTLRERVGKIKDIADVITLDYLSGYQLVLVQLTSDVIREVIGMDVTTLQWELHGGLELRFKVMAIMVPQLRADYNGNTGIVHGNVA